MSDQIQSISTMTQDNKQQLPTQQVFDPQAAV